MLVLTRSEDESVIIGSDIKVTVVEIRGSKVRLGFEAPKDVSVWREEIWVQRLNNEQNNGESVSAKSKAL